MTGSTPGRPMQTSQTLELGGSPSCPIAQPQNIFVRVRGCTWTSMPMTTSHVSANGGHLCFHTACNLISPRDPQRHVLSPLRREDLQAHRQSLRCAARNADPRQSGEVAAQREHVAQI